MRSKELADVEITEMAKGEPRGDAGNLTLVRAIRKWPKVSAWSVAISSTIVLFGFDISIISTVSSITQFQKIYGQSFGDTYIIPSLWLGLWNGSVPIGSILGSIFGGAVQDRVGRRWSLAAASILSAAFVAVAYFSDLPTGIDARRSIFLVAKTGQGFANGMILCIAETYLSEILPPRLRGPGLALFPIATLVGQLIGAIVVQLSLNLPGALAYRTCFASQWPFTVVSLLVAIFVPESPAWLIRVNNIDQARRSFARLDSSKTSRSGDSAFEEVQQAISLEQKRSKADHLTYSQCFQGVDRRRTIIVIFASLIPNMFGIALYASAAYFLQTLGMEVTTSIIFVIVGVIIGLISNTVAFWTLSSIGRRLLILITLSIASVLWVSVGIAGCFRGYAAVWYISICMMVILFCVGMGAWPASFAVAAETSSLRLRARTQGVTGCVSNLVAGAVSIILPYLFNPDSGNLGGRVGFVFAALSGIGAILTWKLVPEMKDRMDAEIDEMFSLNLPAKHFEHWQGEVNRL